MIVNNKGGARPNAGRPTITNKTISRTMRLTDADWLKFKNLGGVKWLRELLSSSGYSHID